jgi:imidazoleglycerol-phosphate dehydratase
MDRKAEVLRKTKETEVEVYINLDGKGEREIETPIGFFNHMLEQLVEHSLFDLKVRAEGDVKVDYHHLVEDVGICLGEAFSKALGDKKGIRRFGHSILAMDEALVLVALDISGRPFLDLKADLKGKVGEFDFELLEVFFRGFVNHALLTLHLRLFEGKNLHHISEAFFKGLALALREAVQLDPRKTGVPSTKGLI